MKQAPFGAQLEAYLPAVSHQQLAKVFHHGASS
jgi:hypothetical protein